MMFSKTAFLGRAVGHALGAGAGLGGAAGLGTAGYQLLTGQDLDTQKILRNAAIGAGVGAGSSLGSSAALRAGGLKSLAKPAMNKHLNNMSMGGAAATTGGLVAGGLGGGMLASHLMPNSKTASDKVKNTLAALRMMTEGTGRGAGRWAGAGALGGGLGTAGRQILSGEDVDAQKILRNALAGAGAGALGKAGFNFGTRAGGVGALIKDPHMSYESLGGIATGAGLLGGGLGAGAGSIIGGNFADSFDKNASDHSVQASYTRGFSNGLRDAATKIAAHTGGNVEDIQAELEEKVGFIGGAFNAAKTFGGNLLGGAKALGSTASQAAGRAGKAFSGAQKGGAGVLGGLRAGATGVKRQFGQGWAAMTPAQQSAMKATGIAGGGLALGAAARDKAHTTLGLGGRMGQLF